MLKLYEKAENTENPFDDYFVEFICGLLGIDIKREVQDKYIDDVNEYQPPKKKIGEQNAV